MNLLIKRKSGERRSGHYIIHSSKTEIKRHTLVMQHYRCLFGDSLVKITCGGAHEEDIYLFTRVVSDMFILYSYDYWTLGSRRRRGPITPGLPGCSRVFLLHPRGPGVVECSSYTREVRV